MEKFNLVISFIVSTLVLTSCVRDYSMLSTKKLCIGYINAGPLSVSQGARKAELNKRDVTNCGRYEAEAEAEAENIRTRGEPDVWEKLERGLKNAQENLKCTRWTFSNSGVKQCLN